MIIDPNTQIRADGLRYTIGEGPASPSVLVDGYVPIWDADTNSWTYGAGGGGGVTDHGALTGLGDNDHTGVYDVSGAAAAAEAAAISDADTTKVAIGAGVTALYVGTDPGAVANGAVWFDTP